MVRKPTQTGAQKPKISHPCAGRSKVAIEVFEAIAIGREPPPKLNTIRALLKAGLIQKTGQRKVSDDLFGPIYNPVYEVPIAIHRQWCQWCAENDSD